MKILIVDDEARLGKRLERLLRQLPGVAVVNYRDGQEDALLGLIELQPDMLILDHRFPNGTGFDVARKVKQYSPETQVVVFSAMINHRDITRYEDAGVLQCIDKTTGLDDLIDTVQRHAQENRNLVER